MLTPYKKKSWKDSRLFKWFRFSELESGLLVAYFFNPFFIIKFLKRVPTRRLLWGEKSYQVLNFFVHYFYYYYFFLLILFLLAGRLSAQEFY